MMGVRTRTHRCPLDVVTSYQESERRYMIDQLM